MKQYNTKLKPSLLVATLSVCVTLPTGEAATDAENYTTPQRAEEREEHMLACAFTDGKKAAQKQAEVLSYERLNMVLGEDFKKFAIGYFTTTDEVAIEQLWRATFNPDTPYNDAQKRNIIRKIVEIVHKTSQNSDPLQMLKASLFDLEQQIREVPLTRIEASARGYFERLFKGSTVTTSWKRGGDQLGCIAEVRLSGGQELTYFVKTHSGGLRSGHSSAAKLVNPAELLVYKVLEELGIGPRSHFFGRDGHNLYIATLDAGTQLNPDGSITKVSFKEYEHFKEAKDPSIQAQLWGMLSQLPTAVEFSEVQHQQAEALMNSEEGRTARNFVREVAKLDVLARIMRLTDFQTNPGNYGFIQGRDGRLKAKAIDFRLNSTDPNEVRFGDYFFNGFLNGNGCFNYSSTGKAMYYALRKRQTHLRVLEAKTIMAEELQQFNSIVDASVQRVSDALTQVPMTADDQASQQKELELYAEIIKSNYRLFRDQLKQWTPPPKKEAE